MSISTTYLLNVALHSAILSVFASLVLLVLRQARHRSLAAIAGLLAVGFLPWLTALRPARTVAMPVPEIQAQEAPALPTWTVVTLPAQPMQTPVPVEPAAAPAKFVFPDPLAAFANIWAAGAASGLFLLAVASLKLLIWRKSLLPLDDTTWQNLHSLSPGIPARDQFLFSATTPSPCVTGLFHPRIVLPKFLLESGSANELRWAVRHEVAHWQAGDSRWMILFTLIRCTNWWNPLVHRLVAKWSESREQLCDLHATGISENRADYGEFLIAMARKITSQPPLTAAMAKRPHALRLKRRIVSLLAATAKSARPASKRFVAFSSAASIGCAVLVSVVRIGAEEPKTEAKINIAAESGIIGKQTGESLPDPASPPPQLPEDHVARPPEDPVPPAAPEKPLLWVKITNKLLMTVTRPVMKDGAVLTNAELQSYLRSISQTQGVDLMTAPSVTSRFGESTVIEIIREVPGTPKQIAARDPKSPAPFTGIRFEARAELLDDQVSLRFDPEYHFIPSVHHSLTEATTDPAPGTDPDKIKIAKRSITVRLSAGQTICSDMGEIEPGQFLQVFTTVEPIDATGRALDGFKNGKLIPNDGNRNESDPTSGRYSHGRPVPPDASPSIIVKGRLSLKAMLVETPLKTPRPPGEGLVIGLTPSDPKVAAKIKNDPRAKVRKLKTAEMPLSEKGTPWPEFPGLNVSAIASKDFSLISISSYAVGDEPGQFPNIWDEMPAGSVMNFGIRTTDPMIERRLLITIEAVK